MEKKRRRSSLFVDRRSEYINGSEKAAANGSYLSDERKEELKDYLDQLKQCKKNWVSYVKDLKMEYKSLKEKGDDVAFRVTEDNYLDYLDDEDRADMGKINGLLEEKLKYDNDIGRITVETEALVSAYEILKNCSENITQNVQRVRTTLIASKSRALAEEPPELRDA